VRITESGHVVEAVPSQNLPAGENLVISGAFASKIAKIRLRMKF
jgi:hypothetical protein